MTLLVLEALRSDDSLGVLAALGVMELCCAELCREVRLGWRGLGGPAVVDADFADVEELSKALAAVARRWQVSGQLVPPSNLAFVAPALSDKERSKRRVASGGTSEPLDPMRMSFSDASIRFAAQRDAEVGGDQVGARWLAGMVNQLAFEKDEERCELTPLYARVAKQNLHQLFRHYRDCVAANPELVTEGLLAWRRVAGDSGANLDDRALRDAASMTGGKADNAAVPGATWLALMSVPFFRQVGDGRRPGSVGWQKVGRVGRPRELVWPVWEQLLDRPAVEILFAHPSVVRVTTRRDLTQTATREVEGERRRLRALGVVAVCAATRRPLGNSDGPLQAAAVRWPRS